MHAGCSKEEPKKICPDADPHPGGAGWLKFYIQTQFGEDRCTQFRVIVLPDPPTHKQTGPITIHCTAASAQCNYTAC